MEYELSAVLLCSNLLNILCHSVGIFSLASLYKSSTQKTQFLYMINLSVCESLIDSSSAIRMVTRIAPMSSSFLIYMESISRYIYIVSYSCVFIVLLLNMMFMTLDRLAKIILNFRYRWYWNPRKATYLIFITWCVGIVLCLSVTTAVACNHFDWRTPFFYYIFPTMEFALIILSISTLSSVFLERKRMERHKASEAVIEIKIRKKLFVLPFLIVFSFILLVIIPHLVHHFVVMLDVVQWEVIVVRICRIFYCMHSFSCVTIYFVLLPDLRKFLWITFRFEKLLWVRNYSLRYKRLGSNTNTAYILPNLYDESKTPSPPTTRKTVRRSQSAPNPNKVLMMISQV